MKLLFACIAVVLLTSNVDLVKTKKKKVSVEDALQKFLPDLDAPKSVCRLEADGEVIRFGEEVCPGATKNFPDVSYKGDTSSLCTLAIIDNGYLNEQYNTEDYPYLLSLDINLSNLANLVSGTIVMLYSPPSLIPKYGLKTVTAYLFEQKRNLARSDLKKLSRLEFKIAEFSRNNSLGDPICGSSYVVQFPQNLEQDDCELN